MFQPNDIILISEFAGMEIAKGYSKGEFRSVVSFAPSSKPEIRDVISCVSNGTKAVFSGILTKLMPV